MKKLLIPFLLLALISPSCNKESEESPKTQVTEKTQDTSRQEKDTLAKIVVPEKEVPKSEEYPELKGKKMENDLWQVDITYVQQLLQKENRSVLDYYYALPYKAFFSCDCEEDEKVRDRDSFLIRKNIKSGYLLARDGCGIMDMAIVLFKDRKRQRDIIAIDYNWEPGDYFCMVDGPMGLFYLNKEGLWEDVKAELIALKTMEKAIATHYYSFLLPEQGTTIKVRSNSDNSSLGELYWRDGFFEFEP